MLWVLPSSLLFPNLLASPLSFFLVNFFLVIFFSCPSSKLWSLMVHIMLCCSSSFAFLGEYFLGGQISLHFELAPSNKGYQLQVRVGLSRHPIHENK